MSRGDGFLERWSSRKRSARGPDAPESRDPQPPPEPEEAPITEEELAALPPVEEAQSAADLRPYLRRGVPEALRRTALRRIWSLNPAIRDYLDPARDYAWDFNAPVSGNGPLGADEAVRLAATLFAPKPEPRQTRKAEEVPSAPDAGGPEARPDPPEPREQPEEEHPRPGRRHGSATPRLS